MEAAGRLPSQQLDVMLLSMSTVSYFVFHPHFLLLPYLPATAHCSCNKQRNINVLICFAMKLIVLVPKCFTDVHEFIFTRLHNAESGL